MQDFAGFLERLLYFKFHVIFFAAGVGTLFSGRDGGERVAGLVVAAVAGFLAYRKWTYMEAEAALREARAQERARRETEG